MLLLMLQEVGFCGRDPDSFFYSFKVQYTIIIHVELRLLLCLYASVIDEKRDHCFGLYDCSDLRWNCLHTPRPKGRARGL
jgi:hypothetical protein